MKKKKNQQIVKGPRRVGVRKREEQPAWEKNRNIG